MLRSRCGRDVYKYESSYGKQSLIKELNGIKWVKLTRKRKFKIFLPGNEVSAEIDYMEVPVDVGTISNPRIRGQPLCFWGFKCNRCLLPLRKPFTPPASHFFGCLPLQGKPKPLRVKDFKSERFWIIGFLEDIAFSGFCHRCTSWGVFCQKKKIPEKGQELRCCIS